MKNTYSDSTTFYAKAMEDISKTLSSKMKAFGFTTDEEIQHEIEMKRLTRNTMQTVSTISERYEYNNITLFEALWTPTGLIYKDINKDERNFERTL